VFLAQRKAATNPAGAYAQQGALVRHPNGGVEDVGRYHQAGIRWLLLNAEHEPHEWATIRTRCDALGVKWGYWFHCRSLGQIEWLLALSKGTRLVGLNVEAEISTTLTPQVIADALKQTPTSAEVCTILLGWQGYVVNGQHRGPDYRPIGHLPALLEIFPQPEGSDGPISDTYTPPRVKWPHCRDHGRALGLSVPLQLAQCYGVTEPGWYDKPYSLYTLDDAARSGVEEWLS
jgi:hypothetical protein